MKFLTLIEQEIGLRSEKKTPEFSFKTEGAVYVFSAF